MHDRTASNREGRVLPWSHAIAQRLEVEGAIAVLNIGGMNDNVQQETQRVDQDVPLATLDLSIGSRSTARRRSRSEPRARSPTVCARRAGLAGSWALRSPIRHQLDRSGNEGHGGRPQGGVQASTSGALQRIKRPAMNHIRFIRTQELPGSALRGRCVCIQLIRQLRAGKRSRSLRDLSEPKETFAAVDVCVTITRGRSWYRLLQRLRCHIIFAACICFCNCNQRGSYLRAARDHKMA